MKPSKQFVTGLFLAAAGLLVGSICVTYLAGLRVIQANRTMADRRLAIECLERVLSTVKDAETGQRGFLLLGKEQYLEPYHGALQRLGREQKELSRFAGTGELSAVEVEKLERLIQQKLFEMEHTLQLRRTNREAALAVVATDQGKNLMDSLRSSVAALARQEEEELQAAASRSYSATIVRTLTFVVTGTLNLAFLLWAYRRMAREIAWREMAVQEITRQKELLGTTLASIGDAVVVTDPQGFVTFLNAEAERLTGWKSAEAQGHPLPKVFPIIDENTRQPVENPVEKVLRLGRVVGLANHTLLLSRDGREIPIDDSAAPIRVPNGSLLGVVLVFRDFTERKRIEEELRNKAEELKKLMDIVPAAIWTSDDPGCHQIRGNHMANTFYEAAEGENVSAGPEPGKTVGPRRFFHDGRELAARELPMQQAAAQNVDLRDAELDVLLPSGQRRTILGSATPLRDDLGHVRGCIAAFVDITQRKHAEQALQEAQAKLKAHAENLERTVEERTAKLTEMVSELQHVSYAIVHDMRAPLRAMSGFASALNEELESGSKPESAQEYCRRIHLGATRLDKLITDALTYTKAVLLEVPMRPVALSSLLSGLLDTYPNLHPDRVDIRLQGQLPVVLGNESLLTQCFSNLLGNAAKFVPPGVRPCVRVWAEPVPSPAGGTKDAQSNGSQVSAGAELAASHAPAAGPALLPPASRSLHSSSPLDRQSPASVRVWVEDNGIGIPKHAQHRLFGMFQKLDRQYEGTGIGLAIVRKVVERMGGRVGAESEPGNGSRFWVELRLA